MEKQIKKDNNGKKMIQETGTNGNRSRRPAHIQLDKFWKVQNISIIWAKTIVRLLKFNTWLLQNILGAPFPPKNNLLTSMDWDS